MSRRRVFMIGVAVASLATAGACARGKKPKTTNERSASDPVWLIEAGAEPRAELRYMIADGTVTKSDMDFRVATLAQISNGSALSVVPGIRLHIVSGPSVHTDDGVRFDVQIEKAEAVIPAGVDSEVEEDLRRSASVLDAVGGTVVIDDRGVIRSTRLNQHARDPELPPRLLMRLINARTTLARVALPAEPVGIGARWESNKEIVAYGFTIQQVDRYTLVDRVGDEIRLNVSVTQSAATQKLEFPEDEIVIELKAMKAVARGEIALDLRALGSDAVANGEATTVLEASTEQVQSKTIQLTETFEVRMTNETARP